MGMLESPSQTNLGWQCLGTWRIIPVPNHGLLTGMILAVEILGLGDSFLDAGKRGRKQISHEPGNC